MLREGGASGRAHQPKHYQKCSSGSVELGGGQLDSLETSNPVPVFSCASLGHDSVGPATPLRKAEADPRGRTEVRCCTAVPQHLGPTGTPQVTFCPVPATGALQLRYAQHQPNRHWSPGSEASGLTPSFHLTDPNINLGEEGYRGPGRMLEAYT